MKKFLRRNGLRGAAAACCGLLAFFATWKDGESTAGFMGLFAALFVFSMIRDTEKKS